MPVRVTAYFYWIVAFQGVTDSLPHKQDVILTHGVTSSEGETQSFARTIGIIGSTRLDEIAEKLNANFQASYSRPFSISLNEKTTDTHTCEIPPNTSYQLWQLVQEFDADGNSITQKLQNLHLKTLAV